MIRIANLKYSLCINMDANSSYSAAATEIQPSEPMTEVFAWGSDRFGQLGLGSPQNRAYATPRYCTFPVQIVSVSCGSDHSALLTSDGRVFTSGSNVSGRLGIGDRGVKLSSAPCFVESLASSQMKEISCGSAHTAAVSTEGYIYAWGVGDYGALGLGDLESRWTPVRVELGSARANTVSCGARHTAIICCEGRVYMCGAGEAGQLGTGTKEWELRPTWIKTVKERVKSAACGECHTLLLGEAGNMLAAGGNAAGQLGTGNKRSSLTFVPIKGPDEENIQKISAGKSSAALGDKGGVYIWGAWDFGEFLIPTLLFGFKAPVKDISIGGNLGAAADAEGTVFTWGTNAAGELGQGDYDPRSESKCCCAVRALREKPVARVACGGNYVIALGKQEEPTQGKRERLECCEKELAGNGEGLKKEIEETQGENKEIQDRVRQAQIRSKILEQGFDSHYREMLGAAEKQLGVEKKKAEDVLQRLTAEKARAAAVELGLKQCQDKVKETESRLEARKKEAEEGAKKPAGESGGKKLGATLREYEERMEREMSEKQCIRREKGELVSRLNGAIKAMENALSAKKLGGAKLAAEVQSELVRLESETKREEARMQASAAETSKWVATQNADQKRVADLEQQVSSGEQETARSNSQLSHLSQELSTASLNLDKTKAEVAETNSVLQKATTDLSSKEAEIQTFTERGKAENEARTKRLALLGSALNESSVANEGLRRTLGAKENEVAALKRESAAWEKGANQLQQRNTELKLQIEKLETTNKKLLEAINFGLYNKAAEFKRRTMRALSNYRTKSMAGIPEGLQELKTARGVESINEMTRFKADTTENIKGTLLPLATERQPFDGKFVLDQEEHRIVEDPKYVKSNFALVGMLDSYAKSEKPMTTRVRLPPHAPNNENREESDRTKTPRSEDIVKTANRLLAALGSLREGTPGSKLAKKVKVRLRYIEAE